jgi:hypothetical protein
MGEGESNLKDYLLWLNNYGQLNTSGRHFLFSRRDRVKMSQTQKSTPEQQAGKISRETNFNGNRWQPYSTTSQK